MKMNKEAKVTLIELNDDAKKRSLQALKDIRATSKDQADLLFSIVTGYFTMEREIKELEKLSGAQAERIDDLELLVRMLQK